MTIVRDFAKAVNYAGGASALEIPLNGAYKNIQISLVGLTTSDLTIKGKPPAETTGAVTVTPGYDDVTVDADRTTVILRNALMDSLELSGASAGSYGVVVHAWK